MHGGVRARMITANEFIWVTEERKLQHRDTWWKVQHCCWLRNAYAKIRLRLIRSSAEFSQIGIKHPAVLHGPIASVAVWTLLPRQVHLLKLPLEREVPSLPQSSCYNLAVERYPHGRGCDAKTLKFKNTLNTRLT